MTDIVERLMREWKGSQAVEQLLRMGADEITRLRTERDNLRAEQRQCEDCDPKGKQAEIERLRAAMLFYRDEAASLAKYMPGGAHTNAVLAVLTVLSLDGGRRADAALKDKP